MVEDCMSASRLQLTRSTIKGYRWYLRSFALWAGADCPIEIVTEDLLNQYFDYMGLPKEEGGKGYRSRMVRVSWQGVGYFCSWLVQKRYLPKNPMPQVKLPPLDAALRPKCSEADALALLSACDRLGTEYQRALTRACIYLLYGCLLRRSEMLNIRLSHLNLQDRVSPSILIFSGKGRKSRTIYPSDDCAQALHDYLLLRHPDCQHDYFLAQPNRVWRLGEDGLYRLIKRVSEMAGYNTDNKTLRPHAMRRGGAGRLLRAGCDIEAVSRKLGHSNLRTTQIYVESDAESQIAVRNLAALIPLPDPPVQAVVEATNVGLPAAATPPPAPDPAPAPARQADPRYRPPAERRSRISLR